MTVCGVTDCPFSRHKGNQRPKCLYNKAKMHLSRNCPFSSKTNLHLELADYGGPSEKFMGGFGGIFRSCPLVGPSFSEVAFMFGIPIAWYKAWEEPSMDQYQCRGKTLEELSGSLVQTNLPRKRTGPTLTTHTPLIKGVEVHPLN